MLRAPVDNVILNDQINAIAASADSAEEFVRLNNGQPLRLYRTAEGYRLFCVGILNAFAAGLELVSDIPDWFDNVAIQNMEIHREGHTGALGFYIPINSDEFIRRAMNGELPPGVMPLAYSLRTIENRGGRPVSLTIFQSLTPQMLRAIENDDLLVNGVNQLPVQARVLQQPVAQPNRGMIYRVTQSTLDCLNSTVRFIWSWRFTLSGVGISLMSAHMSQLYERIAALEEAIRRADLLTAQNVVINEALAGRGHVLGEAPRLLRRP